MLRFSPARSRVIGDLSPSELVVDLLATYRLTTLVKDDKITEDFRRGVFRHFGAPDAQHGHKVSYLVTCPWCLSIYFAGLAVAARTMNRRYWTPVATSLAISALVGLLSEARTRMTTTPKTEE